MPIECRTSAVKMAEELGCSVERVMEFLGCSNADDDIWMRIYLPDPPPTEEELAKLKDKQIILDELNERVCRGLLEGDGAPAAHESR